QAEIGIVDWIRSYVLEVKRQCTKMVDRTGGLNKCVGIKPTFNRRAVQCNGATNVERVVSKPHRETRLINITSLDLPPADRCVGPLVNIRTPSLAFSKRQFVE